MESVVETLDIQSHCAAQILDILPWLRHYLSSAMREKKNHSLSFLELRMLWRLKRLPGISLSMLAEDLAINKATASLAVERLVQQGLATRQENPRNRREVMLHCTAPGLSQVNESHLMLREKLVALMGKLSSQELSQLQQGLSPLRKMLEAPYPQLIQQAQLERGKSDA